LSDVQFFDPAKLPYRGMWSALSGLSLDKGEWLLGENLRVGDRTLRSRWGLKKTGSSPVVNPLHATGFCVGAKSVQANGLVYAMSAWQTTGGAAGTYIYSQNLTTGAWTVLNASSGQFGDTTGATGAFFAGATYTPVDFVSVKDPRSGLEYIVCIGDAGTGIYDPTNSTFALVPNTGGGTTVAWPEDTSGFSSIPDFPVFFSVKDNTAWAPTNSDADWAGTDGVASTTEDYLVMTRSTGAASDATITVVFTSTIDLSSSRQLVMLVDSKTVDIIERLKIQIQEGAGSATTVWDPTTSNYRYEVIPAAKVQKDRQVTATETKFWVAFNLDHIPAASRNAVDTVIFTYIGAVAPTTAVVANVYVIAGSGKVSGNAFHALTVFDPYNRVESLPVFPKIQPEMVKNVGGATLNNMRIPFDQRLFYTYAVGFQNPSTATQVSKVKVYRLDPGDPDPNRYSYVADVTISTYSAPNWSLASGTALSILTYSDTTVSSSRDLRVLAPFPKCRPIPCNCFAGTTIGERMVMAKWVGSGAYNTPSFGELWISEWGNPFRFYEAPYEGDPLSGGKLQMSGEVIYGFAKTATGGYGTESLITFTDKNVYRSLGPTIQNYLSLGLIAQHGTKYRDSIAVYKDSVFWVDYRQDVMKLSSGGLQNLTRNVISDQFSSLPPTSPYLINNAQAHKVSAVYFQNRYYCAVDTSGSDTNSSMRKTRIMVYDDTYNVWSRDTWANSLTTQYLFLADTKMYGIGHLLYTYTMEDGATTTDDSTAFAMNLTTGTIHQDFQAGLEVTRCWVLMDDAASGTVQWTATYLPDGSTRTSNAKSVDVSGSYVLRELRAVGGSNRGAGVTGSVAFVFTVPGGTRVYGISAEIQPVPLVPTAV